MPAAPAHAESETKTLAGLLHDLNNATALLRWSLEAAQKATDEAERRQLLVVALACVPRLRRLLERIDTVTRPKQGRLERAISRLCGAGFRLVGRLDAPAPVCHRVGDVLAETLAVFGATLPPGIRLYLFARVGLWPVAMQALDIERILGNLLKNAREAMPNGGTLTVTAENVEVTPDAVPVYDLRPGRYVVLTLKDTGIGMSHAVRQELFSAGFTTKAQGRGLGLVSVKDILDQHGGGIAVETAPGKGTRFHVYLPTRRPDAV